MNEDSKCRMVVIGASGKQGQEYLEVLNLFKDRVKVVALVDSNRAEILKLGRKYLLPVFTTTEDVISNLDFELALVTLPHHLHYSVTAHLLNSGKDVIKEKPFATTFQQGKDLVAIANANSKNVVTLVQRSYKELFKLVMDNMGIIGTPYCFNYYYNKSFGLSSTGWRRKMCTSCGGVVLDMGYHAIDIVVRIFGNPNDIAAQLSYCYPESSNESLEDAASVVMGYASKNIQGSILISRHNFRSQEGLVILGTDGGMVVDVNKNSMEIFSRSGQLLYSFNSHESKKENNLKMFEACITGINNKDFIESECKIQLQNLSVIEQIYQNRYPQFVKDKQNIANLSELIRQK